MNKCIAKMGKRNGEVVVKIAADYIEAAATLPVYWKDRGLWMDEVEGKIRKGRYVLLADIAYMAGTAKGWLLKPEQDELKAELMGIVRKVNGLGSKTAA